jgi:hypothetical protein
MAHGEALAQAFFIVTLARWHTQALGVQLAAPMQVFVTRLWVVKLPNCLCNHPITAHPVGGFYAQLFSGVCIQPDMANAFG